MTFSVTARAPLVRQAQGDTYHERLAAEGLQCTATVDIGFDTASFVLRGSAEYLTAWFRTGLARDIRIVAPDGYLTWEGYVHSLTFSIGAETRQRSLANYANKVIYMYRALDTGTDPPTTGAQTSLTVENTTAQQTYGIKTVTISGGEQTASAAADDAAAVLAAAVYIPEDGSARFGGGSAAPSLKVGLLGYGWTLDWNPYTSASSGTITRTALVNAILAADPNGFVSTDTHHIQTNSQTVEAYRDGNVPGWRLLREISSAGADGAAWTAGVYHDRVLYYKQREGIDTAGGLLATNQYSVITASLYDAGERYYNRTGLQLRPWELRPDRLYRSTGLRAALQYIEQVTFTEPTTVELRGTDANPLRTVVIL